MVCKSKHVLIDRGDENFDSLPSTRIVQTSLVRVTSCFYQIKAMKNSYTERILSWNSWTFAKALSNFRHQISCKTQYKHSELFSLLKSIWIEALDAKKALLDCSPLEFLSPINPLKKNLMCDFSRILSLENCRIIRNIQRYFWWNGCILFPYNEWNIRKDWYTGSEKCPFPIQCLNCIHFILKFKHLLKVSRFAPLTARPFEVEE